MRPNFFVNTPDILHAFLQYGGPAAFKIRAALAATGSPTWGVYAGYELFEHVAVRPGSEEYLDSEKYQVRVRDWDGAEAEGRTLAPYLTMLNHVRRQHPALQQLRNLTVHATDDDSVLVFSKHDAASGDAVVVVINLDPHGTRETTVHLDLPALGARARRHRSSSTTRSPARTGPGASTTTCASTPATSPPTCSPSGGTSDRRHRRRPGGRPDRPEHPRGRRPVPRPRRGPPAPPTGSRPRSSTRCWSARSATPTATAPATSRA